MIYELAISIYKKLRSKVSVKKTKAKIRKTVIAIRKSRFVKQVRVFVKDTHDTFTVPLYSKLQESLRNVLSSPAVSRFKPVASAIQVAWRFTTKKLSNLPQLALVAAILTPLFSTIILEVHNNRLYGVSQEEKTILTNTSVKKDLIKDTADAFLYNRGDELTIPGSDDPKLKQLLFAASKEDSSGKEPYQAKLPKNPREGIVFGDAEGNRQFTITPNHGLSAGRLDEDSRIVYPKSTTERHIYTLKTNGIKNDITLLEAPEADSGTKGSIKTYTYSLDLGDSLEARKLPNGDIGIYSADPALFGNVQVGDEKSQELIDKARSSNEKNTLVFEIPKPFIIDSNRKINYDDVSFKLVPNQQDQSNPTLELEVRNLKNLPYPVSIDPTIVVTTTSDFQQNIGNNDNIDTSINGQITRGSLGSGAIALGSPELSSAATDTSSFFSIPRNSHTTVAYNGYMYVLGGIQSASATTCKDTGTSQYCNDVQYAPINADGTLGTWTRDTTSYFDIPRGSHTTVAYNGYMYVLGGLQSASATSCKDTGTSQTCNDVQYAPINADGTLGTWTRDTTSYFDIPRHRHTSVAYNGYMYVLGGLQSASATTCKDAGTNNYCNDVQYAPINSDGTLGTWARDTTSYLDIPREVHTTVVVNGYMYVLGGYQSASATTCKDAGTNNYCNDVQYALINADGTLGTWARDTTSYFSTPRGVHTSVAYNGYMYVLGGQTTSTTECKDTGTGSYCNDVQYAPINSDGTLGTWTTDTSSYFSIPRGRHTSVAYNGYMYVLGGNQEINATTCKDTGNNSYCNDVQYLSIGELGNVGTTDFTTTRINHTSVVYNGYLYIIGGGDGTSVFNDIQYCPINSNGSVGICVTQTSAFTNARSLHTSVVYNGYLYIIGGWNGTTRYNDIIKCLINPTGSVTCDTTPPSFPTFTTARTAHTSVAYNGYLYVIGGGSPTLQNDIQRCPINSNGSVGTCAQQTNAFTTARSDHTSVVYNGYLYIIGGWNGTTRYNDIQRCPIKSDGSVDACVQQNSAFTNARYGHSSVVYNGYLYIVGGNTLGGRVNDIQYCPINANGSVGTCIQQGSAFTTARDEHTSVIYGGYLYIAGGTNGTTRYNDIQAIPIVSAGRAGPVTTNATGITGNRSDYASAIYNGVMYITGGWDGTTYYDDIQRCTISTTDGTVGSCTTQSNMFAARREHSAVAYNGFLYIIGGFEGVDKRELVWLPINADGSIGTTSFASGGKLTSYIADGTNGTNGSTYYVHTFGAGTSTFNTNGVNRSSEYMVLGGGGGGGGASLDDYGGGGGAGGLVHNVGGTLATLTGSYTITVGSGGAGGSGAAVGSNGGNSSLGAVASVTGGGASQSAGGSGGGGNDGFGSATGGAGTSGQGSAGGSAISLAAGGGGGKNGVGAGGSSSSCGDYCTNYQGGNGGSGISLNITGSGVSYAGGGGGGAASSGGLGGSGIGGSGSSSEGNGGNAVVNTGSGGGGAVQGGTTVTRTGGSGSDGLVIIRYVAPTTNLALFNTARRGHTSFVYNNYLYIVGGLSGSTYLRSVERCAINANGSIGTCTDQSTALTISRHAHSSVNVGNKFYVIGGEQSAGSELNTIEVCDINGTTGAVTCSSQSTTFDTARRNHGSVYYNGFIYIIGGNDAWRGGTVFNDIQYCPISSTGTIGTCVSRSNVFSTPRSQFQPVVYNGILYAVAGWNGSSDQTSIEYTRIGPPEGRGGSSTANGTGFTTARNSHSSVAYNGYLYIIGGGSLNTIQKCQINTNGSLQSCSSAGTFTTARRGHYSVVYNGYIYVIGGWNGTTYYNDVQKCLVGSDANVTCTSAGTFTTARFGHAAVIINNYIYVIGGKSASTTRLDTVQKCLVGSDANVTCTSAGTFTTARYNHSAVSFNGNIYIIGGWNDTNYYNDIQYCPVNSTTNDLDTCTVQGTAFINPRQGLSAEVSNEYIYIIGGWNGTTRYNDIQYCPINVNGSVGVCTQQASAFTNARYSHASTIFNGYLYINGGNASTGDLADIQYLPLLSTSETARYERTIDVGTTTGAISSYVIQGSANCTYTVRYKLAGVSNVYGSEVVSYNVLPNITQTIIGGGLARYISYSITLDDSSCGGTSNITALALTYNLIPNAPTLLLPQNGQVGVKIQPEFRLGTSDTDTDYLRYKIEVCSTSNCSSIVRTIDQTSSQTGWVSQSQQSGTAFSSGATGITQYAIHNYQTPALSSNTQYWWRGYAIDPNGTNIWSNASSISSFTTSDTTTQLDVNIGGTTIYGGTTIQP